MSDETVSINIDNKRKSIFDLMREFVIFFHIIPNKNKHQI